MLHWYADVNECDTGENNDCDSAANCINTDGSHECYCMSGYTGDGKSCSGTYCSSLSISLILGLSPHITFDRILHVLYLLDINECQSGAHLCDTDSDCVNREGDYTCVCPTGLRWNGQMCAGIHAAYKHREMNSKCTLHLSTDVNECDDDDSNDCNSNAMCINTEGSYQCQCNDGYTGDGTQCEGTLIMYVHKVMH